jgi:hypothetical protein
MPFRCSNCRLSAIDLSRLRPGDIGRLMFFQYPVRCRICGKRGYAWTPLALLRGQQSKRMVRLKPAGQLTSLPLETPSPYLLGAHSPVEWFTHGQTRPMDAGSAFFSRILNSANYWSQRLVVNRHRSSDYQ